jgi:hypothetical protein
MKQQLKRLLTPPFIILAAFLLWFWEWLWEPLEHLMAMIGRWPVLRLLDASIARAYAAVVHFRNYVFDTLHQHPVYQRTRAALVALRQRLRSVRRGLFYYALRRWRAVYRLSRRRGRLTCL